jgi:hypothetical protein
MPPDPESAGAAANDSAARPARFDCWDHLSSQDFPDRPEASSSAFCAQCWVRRRLKSFRDRYASSRDVSAAVVLVPHAYIKRIVDKLTVVIVSGPCIRPQPRDPESGRDREEHDMTRRATM